MFTINPAAFLTRISSDGVVDDGGRRPIAKNPAAAEVSLILSDSVVGDGLGRMGRMAINPAAV